MSKDFELIIASPFDKKELVCEIYFREEILAEISQENNELMLEIYPPKKKEYWKIPFLQFQKVIEDAKNHLFGIQGDVK